MSLRQAEISLVSAKELQAVQDGVFLPVVVVSLAGHGGRYISKPSVGPNPLWGETFIWRIDNRLVESNMQLLLELFQSGTLEAHVGTSSIDLQGLLNDPEPKGYPVIIYGRQHGTITISVRLSTPFKPENAPQMAERSKNSPFPALPSPPPPLVPSSKPVPQNGLPSVPLLTNTAHSTTPSTGDSQHISPSRTNESFQGFIRQTDSHPNPGRQSGRAQSIGQLLNRSSDSLVGIYSPFDSSVHKQASNAVAEDNLYDDPLGHKSPVSAVQDSQSKSQPASSNSSGDSLSKSESSPAQSSGVVSSKPNLSKDSPSKDSPGKNLPRPSFTIPKHRKVFSKPDSADLDSGYEGSSNSGNAPQAALSPQQSPSRDIAGSSKGGVGPGNTSHKKSPEHSASQPFWKSTSQPTSYAQQRNSLIHRPVGLPTGSPQRSFGTPNQQSLYGPQSADKTNSNGNYNSSANNSSEDKRFVSPRKSMSPAQPQKQSNHKKSLSNSSLDENGIAGGDSPQKPLSSHVNPTSSKESIRSGSGGEDQSRFPQSRTGGEMYTSPQTSHGMHYSTSDPALSSHRTSPESQYSIPVKKSFKQLPVHSNMTTQTVQDVKYMRKSNSDPNYSVYHGGKTVNSSKQYPHNENPSASPPQAPRSSTHLPSTLLSPAFPSQVSPGFTQYGKNERNASSGYAPNNHHSHNQLQATPQYHHHPQQSHYHHSPSAPYPSHAYSPQQYPSPQHSPQQFFPQAHSPYPYPQNVPQPGYSFPNPSPSSHPSPSHGLGNIGNLQGFTKHRTSEKGFGFGKGKGSREGDMGAGGMIVGGLAGAVGGLVIADALGSNLIGNAVDGIGSTLETVVNGVGNVVDTTVNTIDGAFDTVVDGVDTAFDTVVGGVDAAFDGAVGAVVDGYDFVDDVAGIF